MNEGVTLLLEVVLEATLVACTVERDLVEDELIREKHLAAPNQPQTGLLFRSSTLIGFNL